MLLELEHGVLILCLKPLSFCKSAPARLYVRQWKIRGCLKCLRKKSRLKEHALYSADWMHMREDLVEYIKSYRKMVAGKANKSPAGNLAVLSNSESCSLAHRASDTMGLFITFQPSGLCCISQCSLQHNMFFQLWTVSALDFQQGAQKTGKTLQTQGLCNPPMNLSRQGSE